MEVLAGGGVTSAKGFLAGAVAAGIKKSGALDLSIVWSESEAAVAGVFTQNKVRAAPVVLSEQRVKQGAARGVVVNAGNANACTADEGMANAQEMAALTAGKLGARPEEILVASTGVIGVQLPMEKVRAGIAAIDLSQDGGARVAQAIMTTDLRPKERAVRLEIGGQTVTIGGMAKGSGMIHPNMATMLAFITTDAAVDPVFLHTALREAAATSFNMISVDGDTSTNDTLVALANGAAGNAPITAGTPEAVLFQEALDDVAIDLAKAIARDGEGATKLIEMVVEGARSLADARTAARAVVSSSLFKAAVYGADPNWGRILCALGYSGADVDALRADIRLGSVDLMKNGEIQQFDRAAAVAEMAGPDVLVSAHLHLGDATARAWGCDLTEGYVDINGRYTT
ncbi:MAG TPA: bifunctional glutamate N-acetyltransferase/amino-acid acetyltransferase ArgJ [Chloroflexota bacterium]|nr:bifunctional glutamate N-acetyltransferase/amino-acid acetyltransferase ArgJ [Chloroflexota bacterium]